MIKESTAAGMVTFGTKQRVEVGRVCDVKPGEVINPRQRRLVDKGGK